MMMCSQMGIIWMAVQANQTLDRKLKMRTITLRFLQWMPESNVSDNSLNFDVGVLRQKDEHVEADVPCTIANESSPVQVVANYHASDQNLSEQIHPPVTQGIERRTVGNRRFRSVTPRREEEPAASQRCCSFEHQEEMMELKEQLMESEAEIQQLRAELGRYLFLEDKEKRSGKLQLLLSRAPTSDERRQYAANSSFNKTSVDRTLLIEGASLKRQPGIAALSPASLPLKDKSLNLLSAKDNKKKIIAMHRFLVTGRSLALSGEADIGRISGNQEDSSCESFLSFESSVEIEEIPASVDIEDYEGLLLERVRTNGKVDNHVPFSFDSSSKTGNHLPPQNSCEPGQLTEGSREPHAATSSDRNLESQGTQPKHTQTQHPVNTPLWPSSSRVSDGLAKDSLARHSQYRATHEILYTDDRDLPSLVPELLRDNLYVDGLTSASEAYKGAHILEQWALLHMKDYMVLIGTSQVVVLWQEWVYWATALIMKALMAVVHTLPQRPLQVSQ